MFAICDFYTVDSIMNHTFHVHVAKVAKFQQRKIKQPHDIVGDFLVCFAKFFKNIYVY